MNSEYKEKEGRDEDRIEKNNFFILCSVVFLFFLLLALKFFGFQMPDFVLLLFVIICGIYIGFGYVLHFMCNQLRLVLDSIMHEPHEPVPWLKDEASFLWPKSFFFRR